MLPRRAAGQETVTAPPLSPDQSTAPGWFGKLPSLGDFASRRLPHEFITVWDAWLQDALNAARATLGGRWDECYLTSPIWRFVLLPNLIGSSGWAGVLMPSVDRVGRHFPLTLATQLSSVEAVAHALRHGQWFERLEQTALTVLDASVAPDDLDRQLRDQRFEAAELTEVTVPVGSVIQLASINSAASLAQEALALTALRSGPGWQSLWWTGGRIDATPLMLACGKLPTHEEFPQILVASLSP